MELQLFKIMSFFHFKAEIFFQFYVESFKKWLRRCRMFRTLILVLLYVGYLLIKFGENGKKLEKTYGIL